MFPEPLYLFDTDPSSCNLRIPKHSKTTICLIFLLLVSCLAKNFKNYNEFFIP
jgi:hypothetical protein